MSKKEQAIEIMRDWFLKNFETPADACCPYDDEEDSYIFYLGGPYDPLEQLSGRFSERYKDEWIEELAKELTEQAYEWSGSSRQVS